MPSVHQAQWDNHTHCATLNKTFHYSSNISNSLQLMLALKTSPWFYTAVKHIMPHC